LYGCIKKPGAFCPGFLFFGGVEISGGAFIESPRMIVLYRMQEASAVWVR
jgi:hypothetical protein